MYRREAQWASRELLEEKPFRLIGSDWMLITEGSRERFNTMTASWGGLGVLWERRVAFCFIRPVRYTYEFVEQYGGFSLSFFSGEYRKALQFCGSHSGRDTDKIRETGLTPVHADGFVYFAEAPLVLHCRKLYTQDLRPDRFLDDSLDRLYPQKDYHRMYVGEIVRCLERKDAS